MDPVAQQGRIRSLPGCDLSMYSIAFDYSDSYSPADGTTIYFGRGLDRDANANTVRALFAGTLIGASVGIRPHGGQCTTEVVTVSAYIDGAATLLETAKTLVQTGGTVPTYFSNAAMSVNVDVDDVLQFQIIWPTWVTNPTNVRFTGEMYFTDDVDGAAQSAATANILTNDSDISAVVAEQLTQDSSISAALASILTNDSDISSNLATRGE